MGVTGTPIKTDLRNDYEQAEHDDSDIAGKKVKLLARESVTDKRLTATTSSGKVGLDINISGSDVALGGGTQYTEGDIDSSITGTAVLWEDTSDTLRPVSATKPLPVDLGV